MEGNMALNYDKILGDKTVSSIVKDTVRLLQRNPYLNVGTWFQSLTANDLLVLNLMVELACNKKNQDVISDLILLSEMLSSAEGADVSTEEERVDNLNYFCILVTIAALDRKGLVTAHYDKMSFGKEMRCAVVVELKDANPQY